MKENIFLLKENASDCFQTCSLKKAAINQKDNKKIKTNSKKLKLVRNSIQHDVV